MTEPDLLDGSLSPDLDMAAVRAAFPSGFWWGAATAAYQIEGAVAEDGRRPSIWDTFSHTPGATHGGDTGDVAADHYHRMPEDVGLMARLGLDAYRFSIAWPRILPEGTGPVNRAGVTFYRDLCERLLDAGITPVATLYHWDLPQALQDHGGWLDARSAEWFAEYAAVAKDALGDLVSVWATLNEPWCSAFLGHTTGEHAPGGTDPGDGFVAAHHLMLAHHAGIAALRRTRPRDEDRLGIVHNLIPAWPASDSEADRRAADAIDAIHNRLFLDAVFAGRYPNVILDLHRRFGVDDRIDLAVLHDARQDSDYLGVNYYNVNHAASVPGAPAPGPWPGADGVGMVRPPGPLTAMGWGVEPEGLGEVLRRVTAAYPSTPIYICENGAAYEDEVSPTGEIHDARRRDYLMRHIAVVAEAIAAGADVRGYFVWSLMDNFEWAHGYTKHFGVVHVDPETLVRTVKASGHWYRDFIRDGAAS